MLAREHTTFYKSVTKKSLKELYVKEELRVKIYRND